MTDINRTVQHDATAVAHAPLALTAVGDHCLRYKLIAPHTIEVPTLGDPEMRLHLVDTTANSWLATVTETDRTVETVNTPVVGRAYQRVFITAILPDTGIRVTLRFLQPAPALQAVTQ